MQTVESKIREYLLNAIGFGELDSDKLGLDDDITLTGMDSLDDVGFVMWAEGEFNLEISDDDAEAWVTLRDVVKHIEDRA